MKKMYGAYLMSVLVSTVSFNAMTVAGEDVGAQSQERLNILIEIIKQNDDECVAGVQAMQNLYQQIIQDPRLSRNVSVEDLSALSPEGIRALVNMQDKSTFVPLYYVVQLNRPKCVKALLEAGANVNTVIQNGKTPLFFAQDEAMVRLLLKNGADAKHRDDLGRTADYYVGRNSAVDLIRERQ